MKRLFVMVLAVFLVRAEDAAGQAIPPSAVPPPSATAVPATPPTTVPDIMPSAAALPPEITKSLPPEITKSLPPETDWKQYKVPYAEDKDKITLPRHTTDEVAIWAQETAADVLSFTHANHLDRLESFRKYFQPTGWEMYGAFVKDSKFINMVVDGQYSATTIVSRTPEITSHGVAEGAYRWIVKAPLTVSFFSVDATGKTVPNASEDYILYMDIARSMDADSEKGLVIGSWRMDDLSESPAP